MQSAEIGLVFWALLLAVAEARGQGTLQFEFLFDNVFSGATPAGTSPWVLEQFSDVSPGNVLVTVWNNESTTGYFIGDLYLNLNPNLDPTALMVRFNSGSPGVTAATISTGEDQFKADGDGYYDLQLSFSSGSSGRFSSGNFMSYDITGIAGLSSADFEYTSTSSTAALLAAAHLIGNGGSSSWLNPSQVTQVPEPGAILGWMFFTLALVVKRRAQH